MPIVELDIAGTPTRVEVSDGYTPEDLDHIATALTPSIKPAEARARSSSYLYNKANQFVGAMQGVGQDVQNLVGGQPYGAGFPGQRSGWDTASDVATAAAPVVAPRLTALGLAAGTLATGAGYDEPTADAINAGTQLGVGGIQAATSAGRAVAEAPAKLKAAAQAKYAQAAEGAAGKLITADNPFVQQLSDALESNLTHPAERAMATPLLNKATTPGSPGLTYNDLDNALAGLRKVRGQSYVRGLIDDAAQSLVEGTPAGQARTAAKAAWSSLRSKPFRIGGLVPGVTGASLAARDISEGRYKRAALTLGGTALATAGLHGLTGRGMVAATQGAAGPLAQTAVGAGSVLSGLAGPSDSGYTAGSTDSGSDTPVPTTPPAAPAVAGGGATPIKPLAGPYGREIAAVASLMKIPAPLLQSVMKQESGGNPNALSHPEPGQAQTPAYGLMQITPGTFASVAPQVGALIGRKPQLDNPLDNIVAAGVLWRHYLDLSKGDVKLAGKMYFGGEGGQAWGYRTEQYGNDISRRYASNQPTAAAPAPTSGLTKLQQEQVYDLQSRVAHGDITQEQMTQELQDRGIPLGGG